MGRKKVRHEFIINDSIRRTTFKKRKASLLKKDVWPSLPEAHRVIEMFKSLPTMKRSKNLMDQEGFLKKTISKSKETLKKQKKKNQELEIKLLMSECLKITDMNNLEHLKELSCLLDEKNKQITKMIELKKSSISAQVVDGNKNEGTP
ncbi:hypothetical protein L1049_026684 [Liquidambar formosana]|uniref:MADS-box domain-containing protein n=1 Tax=Liquidambar formosana TaxID=63359 RepID=A0AAP0R6M3_LIQFO